MTRPVLELQAFARVSLDPGADATIDFDVAVADLGFHDRDGRYVVEPGEVNLLVGNSAADVTPIGTITIKGDATVPARRTFRNSARPRPAP